MCRWFLGLPTVCLLLISPARGDQTFPYKAYVTSSEVYVRSGPGKNYYPTSKLKTGDAGRDLSPRPGRLVRHPAAQRQLHLGLGADTWRKATTGWPRSSATRWPPGWGANSATSAT